MVKRISDKQKENPPKIRTKTWQIGKWSNKQSLELASKAADDINEENEIVVGKLAEDRITLSPIKKNEMMNISS